MNIILQYRLLVILEASYPEQGVCQKKRFKILFLNISANSFGESRKTSPNTLSSPMANNLMHQFNFTPNSIQSTNNQNEIARAAEIRFVNSSPYS